jgi:hypothetical protein
MIQEAWLAQPAGQYTVSTVACAAALTRTLRTTERGAAGVEQPSGTEQPETLAVMDWIRTGRFTASASLHEVAPRTQLPTYD